MFESVLTLLADNPLLLLALLLTLGSLLGEIKVAGASLGPAAVLIIALALTAWGLTFGVELAVPEVLGIFGLVLFTYTIGIISGPSFFGSLKRDWTLMLSTAGCLAIAAVAGGLLGRALGLPSAVIAGTFAGATTNTTALAAASEAAGNAELPAIGYSITYLYGVVGMIIFTALALRRGAKDKAAASQDIEQRTIEVDGDATGSVAQLLARFSGAMSITRIQHPDAPMEVAEPRDDLRRGDLVSVIGPRDVLDAVTAELGHASATDIIGDRTHLDSNRVTLSAGRLVGRRVGELGLQERFGAHVSRVRRGDVDIVATADLTVQMGDRLRVVAPREHMRAIRKHLGDSSRGFSDINPVGLAIGLLAGLVIGMIPIPLPTGTFSLGAATGTLLTGLVLGRVQRIGKVPMSMPAAAAQSLSSLGMLIFLAYAGTRAGTHFLEAVTSSLGWKVALLGVVITTVLAVTILVIGRLAHRTNWVLLAGHLGGAQTQPAVLAYADARTGFDNRVAVGYALLYPAAMIAKILLAQALVLLG